MRSASTSSGTIKFAEFEVELATRELRRQGVRVPLQELPFQVLLALLQSPGRIVTREEIRRNTWPETAFGDFENGLNVAIRKARVALGDLRDKPRFIETVPRRGYRFVAATKMIVAGGLPDRGPGNPLSGTAPINRRPPLAVGYSAERELLRDCYRSVLGGKGLLVSVRGEAGAGKTTLIEGFLAGLDKPRPLVAGGRCSERFAGTEAYTVWLDVLEHLVRGPDGSDLLKLMDASAPLWRAWIAHDRSMPSPRPDVAHILEQTLKRQIAHFLREAGKRRPLALFLDDLHWVDPSTIDVLGYLADRRDEIRVLLLTAYRPEYCTSQSDPLQELLREQRVKHGCCEITLDGLQPEDIRRYLDLSFPGHTFPGDFVALIGQQTEGNPLFLSDLVDHFLEEGVIFRDRPSDQWSVVEPIAEIGTYVPPSVHALIESRMQRLDRECRRLLSIASIQGCEFDAAVLSAVADSPRSAVEDTLASAEPLGLFRHVLDVELPDRSTTRRYRFTHSLYQNALHGMLSPGHLSEWSAAVADALLTLHAGRTDRVAAAVARLFEAAGDAARAAAHFAIAAGRTLGICASRETVASAERGLSLVSSLPTGVTRDKLELQLLIPLGSALSRLRGYAAPRVGEAYQRIYELCNRNEIDSDLQAALHGLTFYSLARAELSVAREAAGRLVAAAEQSGDRCLLVWACCLQGITMIHRGELAEAELALERARAAWRKRDHETLIGLGGFNPGCLSLGEAARLQWLRGYPKQASAVIEETVRAARSLNHPYTLAGALFLCAWVRHYLRDFSRCVESADESLALIRHHSLFWMESWVAPIRASALSAMGSPVADLSEIRHHLLLMEKQGSRLMHTEFMGMLAEALNRTGNRREADRVLVSALLLAEMTGERYYEPELYRLKAECLDEADDSSTGNRAGSLLSRAREIAREQGARIFELRAAIAAASRLARLDRRAEGAAIVHETLSGFTEGFETSDLQEAIALSR